ncbi:MAG: deoxyguanosinetriphosphate triphosphohydrolase [Verrucomicrobiales bacterium]|nr:deoxyguanosinetriphosphate triphosphohydrolase [Verrucomicrobiales bacterium]|tara:strand:+ start:9662 stop:10924 length:1263 start_codon:yes stop_codon:yes gene_type:complete
MNQFYNQFDITPRYGTESDRPDDYRTPFQIDRDRIIYTPAFRKLQSKTQVFLSGEYDFYRTRLTHSLEVAQIGRSICNRLKRKSDYLNDEYFIDPDLVEASCLSHDLGHPPFGHAGERVLHNMMFKMGGYEGNAQTLRLLTETIWGNSGMNPTRAFLDSTLKYKTLLKEKPDSPNHFIYDYQENHLDFVFDGLNEIMDYAPGSDRNGFKSVECQIMDWADDTAYSLNDIIDGTNAGFINSENLEKWAEKNELDEIDTLNVETICRAIKRKRLEPLMGRKVGDFIASANLEEASENFMAKKTCRYQYKLHVEKEITRESKLYKKIALDLIFKSPQLQQLDYKASRILGELFKIFFENYVSKEIKPLFLLGADAEALLNKAEKDDQKSRIISDIISEMTDRLAVRTYRRLIDPNFGSIMDLV